MVSYQKIGRNEEDRRIVWSNITRAEFTISRKIRSECDWKYANESEMQGIQNCDRSFVGNNYTTLWFNHNSECTSFTTYCRQLFQFHHHFYRPRGKIMFSEVSVGHSVHGRGGPPPPPGQRPPPRQRPPWTETPVTDI